MHRFASTPVRQIGPMMPLSSGGVSHTLENTYNYTDKLSLCPRNLLLIWQEYLYGLEDNKTTKNLMLVEYGCVKFEFCHRKCFWEAMVKIYKTGFTNLSSIDKGHHTHGLKLSVSTILAMMQNDKKVGGHLNLSL
jgi:hypothetical protein